MRVAISAAIEPPLTLAEEAITVSDSPGEITPPHMAASFRFRIALQAGLFGVMANIIPFGIGLIITGFLAALLYKRAGGGTLSPSAAARLGALAGTISFAGTSILTVIAVWVLHAQQQFREMTLRPVEQAIAQQPDPQVQHVLQWLLTPEGFGFMLAFAVIVALLMSMLFSAVGAMLGARIFHNRSGGPL